MPAVSLPPSVMKPRILPPAVVFLAVIGNTPAQESRPQDPKPQDPEVAEQDPGPSRVEELQKEKARLIQEIGYVRELLAKGGLAAGVAAKLKKRTFEPQAVDAGTSNRQIPMASVKPKPATLLTDEQKKALLPDVIFTVEGRPVRQPAYDELMDYLKQNNPDADPAFLRSRTLMELIATEYAQAMFPETAAQAATQIREIEASIGRGVEFAELAKNRSRHPSAGQGGDIGFIVPNSGHPVKLEQVAFSTEVGKVSPIFRTPLGYNILRVTEEKEADAGRSVRVSVILVSYHEALEEVQEIQRNVSLGRATLAFRDEELRQALPPMYR